MTNPTSDFLLLFGNKILFKKFHPKTSIQFSHTSLLFHKILIKSTNVTRTYPPNVLHTKVIFKFTAYFFIQSMLGRCYSSFRCIRGFLVYILRWCFRVMLYKFCCWYNIQNYALVYFVLIFTQSISSYIMDRYENNVQEEINCRKTEINQA